jgi:inhibitor of KinA
MTLFSRPRLLPLGDGAVTIQFGDEVSPEAHGMVMGFVHALGEAAQLGSLQGVVEWVPAYASVTVRADDTSEAAAQERDALLMTLAEAAQPMHAAGRPWRLPICFDDAEFAPDLAHVATARGLSIEAVIAQIIATPLRVYMLGFMPGFPYMGELPRSLEMPRLPSPRRAVPARSIGITGRMLCIYPWLSPGGWNLIGRTPLRPFDLREAEPALLRAGDGVTWQRVDRAEFDRLEIQADAGTLSRGSLRVAAP